MGVRVSDLVGTPSDLLTPPPRSVVASLFILTLGRTHPCRIMTTLLTVLTFIKPIAKQNLLYFYSKKKGFKSKDIFYITNFFLDKIDIHMSGHKINIYSSGL